MKVDAILGDIITIDSDAAVIYLHEDFQELDENIASADTAISGGISALISDGEIQGKRGEITIIHSFGKITPKKLVIVGLGKTSEFSSDLIRNVFAQVARRLRSIGVVSATTLIPTIVIDNLSMPDVVQSIAEGCILGLYRFTKHFTTNDVSNRELESLTIVDSNPLFLHTINESLNIGTITSKATILARDMVNEPSNYMTPSRIAEIAEEIAYEYSLTVEILDINEIRSLQMGGLLGVSKGSMEPPKFIVLNYIGDPDNRDNNLALIGKGITFDTGGISLKPPAGMMAMKGDMAGAASVIAAIQAIAQIKPKLNVTCLIAATENMPSGSAQKPGDVLKTFGGKTVEVENTDAEGRLVLADAIGYANYIGLKRIVDVATLTGAIVTALGDLYTGGFTNDQIFFDKLLKASNKAGENIWQLPMHKEYASQNKSQVADVKNTGGRKAGSIAAAQFLSEFIDDASWIHLDIAGTAESDSLRGYKVKGATGTPTRTLINLAIDLAQHE